MGLGLVQKLFKGERKQHQILTQGKGNIPGGKGVGCMILQCPQQHGWERAAEEEQREENTV